MKPSKPFSLPVIYNFLLPKSSNIIPPDVKTPDVAVNQARNEIT
jgi:hypothetical protein